MRERLQKREVVTAFLRHNGMVMVVHRSERVGSYRGCWSGISGYLEDIPPFEQAVKEIAEETGLSSEEILFASSGRILEVADIEHGVCWVIHPFLFDIEKPEKVRLDWENTELRWIDPGELASLDTVPSLAEALKSCLDAVEDVG